jgi:hypothetical protein
MTCDSVSELIPLYYYGELTPDEEERVDDHLHGCTVCAQRLEEQRTLAAALDRRQSVAPPALLEECRADLMAAIAGGAPKPRNPEKGPWRLFLEAMASTFDGFGRVRQPIGALALIAIGFFAARFSGTTPQTATVNQGLAEDVFATVRSVQPDAGGHVQIAFDETRRRTMSGALDNPNIQRLLRAAAHDDNPAVRVESVGILKDQVASSENRDILLDRVMHDSNAGVRLHALEGLKPLATDAQVRKTLAQVLLSDDNPAVRMQVVDLLVAHRDGATVGVLQDVVQKEDDRTIRMKLEKALKEMNASIGTF